jgi:hypothetical protein
MILQHGNHRKAQFLVEPWCLETVRPEDDLLAATGAGFPFRCLEELGPDIFPSKVGMHPDRLDGTTPTPGPAFDSSPDGLLGITDKDRQPLSIIDSGLLDMACVEVVCEEPGCLRTQARFLRSGD